MYENYRIPLSTHLSFLTNIGLRVGRNIYVQYYNIRLKLSEFAADSIIEHTLSHFID
jgi:hypothetical protein